jgi:hypothetical protein
VDAPSPLHLSAAEIYEATGYRRAADQSRRLTELGIKHHRQAVTGYVVVKRYDYEHPTPEAPVGVVAGGQPAYGVDVIAMEAFLRRGKEKNRSSRH